MQYRWQYSNSLSILHRCTGLFQTLCLLLLVYWLVALASGPAAYDDARVVLGSLPVRLVFVAWSFAFVYHLLNGIRHLVWDVGHGLERATARRSGWGVVAGALVLTAALWLAIAMRLGGGAA
jgi:succinate dehydrogenase / fumarate reductase cytochrome b subunit